MDRNPAAGAGRGEDEGLAAAKIDTSVPHAPRIWNYWPGGTDNFAVDRRIGDRMAATYPDIVRLARADRAFLRRAVRHLAGEEGIRQFLDIGTGLPTADNTHEVAQSPKDQMVMTDRAIVNGPDGGHCACMTVPSGRAVGPAEDGAERRPQAVVRRFWSAV